MLIAFSGLQGSGKDTAALVLIEEYGFTKIAFADAVREMAIAINPYVPIIENTNSCPVRLNSLVQTHGWDKVKRTFPEARRLLQVIGTEAGRMLVGENVWVDILKKKFPDVGSPEARYVITDCRFSNEVNFVKDNGGQVIWIHRPGLKSDGHASESTELRNQADYQLSNDETIEEFQEDIRFMLFMRGVDPIERSIGERSS